MTPEEFHGWKNSVVGREYFRHLAEYARALAEENGRAVGLRGERWEEDFMILAKQAGRVEGIEEALNYNPFEEEYEDTSGGAATSGEAGL